MFENWDKEICIALPSLNDLRLFMENKPLRGSPQELRTLSETRTFLQKATRVYFGHETCARRLPQRNEIIEAFSLCLSSEKEMSLVLPYMGERNVKSIISAIEVFSSLNPGEEIITSDFGIINFIKEKNVPVKIILGRLLGRLKRDPLFTLSSEKSHRESSRSSFSVPSFANFFLALGISRAGFDSLPQGIDVSDVSRFEFDAYWPWVYVTSGRGCQLLGANDFTKGKYPFEAPCNKECLISVLESEKKGNFYTIQKGNAVWMEILHPGKLSGNFTRLIYEPVIPA
ncbi:MAG: hypothetical protein WC565_01620 [Parcubacteria group bacterium]